MPKFSTKSEQRLQTCHPDIQRIMYEAIQFIDFSIVYGFRNEEDQNRAYLKGHSTKPWPKSKHNTLPSIAIDILPYPSGWPQSGDPDNIKKHKLAHFYYQAGVIMRIAYEMNIKLRWGGDWDMDKDFLDQTFDDLAHFELIM